MKKITTLALVVIAISLASCKKNRTCTCVTTGAGVTSTTTNTTIKDTKKKATEACENGNTSTTVIGITYATNCTLD
jgi:hypothetical protein